MAECIQCGEYTNFSGGLCVRCYKLDQSSKEKNQNPLKKDNRTLQVCCKVF